MKVYRAGANTRNTGANVAQGKRSLVIQVQQIAPRTLAFLLLLLLGLQFLVGMLTNFYVEVPTTHPGANASNYFVGVAQGVSWAAVQGSLFLLLHVWLGMLVFIGSLWLLGRSIVLRDRGWIIIASLGVAGIMSAGFNGASFMNYGHDFSSLLMSIGFLLALVSYLVGLYLRP
ncbi:MAG TPA: hypothetical protein VKQ36_00295, partial [Ktedonobacterales bacterium]|nr:hypothetical protein [Ktedonobacterales bacterium]